MKTKKIIFQLICLAIFVGFVQCKERTQRERRPVSERTETTTSVQQERQEPRLVYDDRGNIIERHSFTYRPSNGSIRSSDSYYYRHDDRNNVIKEIKESYDPDGTLKYKNINHYTYNDKDLLTGIRFESYDSENRPARTARHAFRYNERGQKIEDIGYYDNGSVKSRIILDPDEAGAPRSEEYIEYDEQGIKTSHKKYYYSQHGLERTEDKMN